MGIGGGNRLRLRDSSFTATLREEEPNRRPRSSGPGGRHEGPQDSDEISVRADCRRRNLRYPQQKIEASSRHLRQIQRSFEPRRLDKSPGSARLACGSRAPAPRGSGSFRRHWHNRERRINSPRATHPPSGILASLIHAGRGEGNIGQFKLHDGSTATEMVSKNHFSLFPRIRSYQVIDSSLEKRNII